MIPFIFVYEKCKRNWGFPLERFDLYKLPMDRRSNKLVCISRACVQSVSSSPSSFVRRKHASKDTFSSEERESTSASDAVPDSGKSEGTDILHLLIVGCI